MECYYISHNINTSYLDLLDVTPVEKDFMLSWINKEMEQRQEAFDKAKTKK